MGVCFAVAVKPVECAAEIETLDHPCIYKDIEVPIYVPEAQVRELILHLKVDCVCSGVAFGVSEDVENPLPLPAFSVF